MFKICNLLQDLSCIAFYFMNSYAFAGNIKEPGKHKKIACYG